MVWNLEQMWELWRRRSETGHRWPVPFVLPHWIAAWNETLGARWRVSVLAAGSSENPTALLPLLVRKDEARFAGDPAVCDYFDAVFVPGKEEDAARELLNTAWSQGIRLLDLGPVRPDSFIHTVLGPAAEREGLEVSVQRDGVTVEMALPESWDAYLQTLSGKQRHEVRRKLRRLEEAGPVDFRVFTDFEAVRKTLPVFYRLFRESREDKAGFLTGEMIAYFDRLCASMSRDGFVRLSLLLLEDRPIASALCFDDGRTIYLYNNGYDPEYRRLSAGLMVKVFTIRDALELGRKRYDFLRGDEIYKFRLGGTATPLHRMEIRLERNGP